ncbi:hypothetical protein ACFSTC_37055 [Nonomuraea ferruginea]
MEAGGEEGGAASPSTRVASASASCWVIPAMLRLSPSMPWVTMGAARTVRGTSTTAICRWSDTCSSMRSASFCLYAGATAMRTE